MINNPRDLFLALLNSTKPSGVKVILREIGDHSEAEVGETFGPLKLCWKFYGDNESNISTINIATQPERSLIERITNAIDAVIEGEFHKRGGKPPQSPMEAVSLWFGRPTSTAEGGLSNWEDYAIKGHDKHVNVVLLGGDDDIKPTIDVLDDGIGIKEGFFHLTILSLQEGNKRKKKYLAGAFGQGGSSTLGFSEFTFIASRHLDQPQRISFTLVKKLILSEDYKDDAYVYLAIADGAASEVPHFDITEDIELYNDLSNSNLHLKNGTLVRSYGYSLERYNKPLSPSANNLYHLLHTMMFDPLLPFRVIDLRNPQALKNELVTGSRNRLMKLALKKEEGEDEEGRTVLKHHGVMEMVNPISNNEPSIGVEYWVVFNYKKQKGELVLRPSSNELFVNKDRPILGTVNGQNQGEETAHFIRKLNLSLLSRHMVIHINVTNANKDLRNQLLSTTREGFRKDKAYYELLRIVEERIKDDDALYALENELVESIFSQTDETDETVKREIVKLLRNSGYEVSAQGYVLAPGDGDTEDPTGIIRRPRRPPKPLDPLLTLAYPDVTKFKIVQPEGKLSIRVGKYRQVKVETDANSRFDREHRIAIRFSPELLEQASKSLLKGGRINWRIRVKEGQDPGGTGRVIASLTLPDGGQLTDQIDYEILPAPPAGDEEILGKVPPFEIVRIDPVTQSEKFQQIWQEVPETEIPNIAYKPLESNGGIKVFYSIGFKHYASQFEKLKRQESLAKLFQQSYEIWIAYHAILQHRARKESAYLNSQISETQLDQTSEIERALVAELQVKQALQIAALKHAQIKASQTSD